MIEQRIQKLEKELKYYRRMSHTVVFILGAFLLMAAKGQVQDGFFPSISTRKITLTDKDGKALMVLESRETAAGISLRDKSGNDLIFLGADATGQGGFIEISDSTNNNIMQLRANNQGAALKVFKNKTRNIIYLGEDDQHKIAGQLVLGDSRKEKPGILLDGSNAKVFLAHPKQKGMYMQLPE